MFIKAQCPSDNSILSPQILLSDVHSFSQQPIKFPTRNRTRSQTSRETLNQGQNLSNSLRRRTKKRDQQGLKKLIRQQKVKMITKRFIQKLKLNNTNSQPIVFQPYSIKQSPQSFRNVKGVQLPDIYEKILSIFIAFYIIVCLFIDSTATLFPEILNYSAIKFGQYTALIVFLVEFVSSCIVVKMVEGKKVDKVSNIVVQYVADGLFIDFAYLVILIVSFFTNVGFLRLIILLKLPECFERIERIQNAYVNTFYKEQYWGLAKVFLLNFALSHFLSLILIQMATIQPDNSWMTKLHINDIPWYQQYIWGYYWGTTIMLTVGFGDITPSNYQQAICLVLIQTFSCLALAYNINCVGNLISNIKSQDIQKNKNIKTFKTLSSRNNISQDLQLKISNYIQESTNIKKKFNPQQEATFTSSLPSELKADFLKQSNKKIFQNLVFLKNLTEKTLLSFAQSIHMKICHPEEVIKKRGELSGLMILKEGRIGFTTKLNGSDFSNITIDNVKVKENDKPYLISLDFISRDRSNYQIKSEEYSILYFLSLEQTLQILKMGQMDYEHFCFLRDRARNVETQYQVFKCDFCKSYHTKFDCPKLHYMPLKKHVIDKYLYQVKISKNKQFKDFHRQKKAFKPFKQLQNNLKVLQFGQDANKKYTSWKRSKPQVTQTLTNIHILGMSLKKQQKSIPTNHVIGSPPTPTRSIKHIPNQKSSNYIHYPTQEATQDYHPYNGGHTQRLKALQHHYLIDLLKDQISQTLGLNNNEVWLLECDQIKNYKFYFSHFNANTLQYLNKKESFSNNLKNNKSLFK